MCRAGTRTKRSCAATICRVALLASLLASNGVLADAASTAAPSTPDAAPPVLGDHEGDHEKNDPAEAEGADEPGFFERWFLGLWRKAAHEAQREPSVIVAKVRGVKQLMRTRFNQIYLDNSQTWRENGIQPNTSYRVGDSVVIYKLPPPREHLYDLRNQRTGEVVRVIRLR